MTAQFVKHFQKLFRAFTLTKHRLHPSLHRQPKKNCSQFPSR
jgi:hypothetical protein